MDAISVLEAVARTYVNLKTLKVEILITNELENRDSDNQDVDVFLRREKRARAFYSAPDKVRIEQGGRRGSLLVTNGMSICYFMAGLYLTKTTQTAEAPGFFRPDFPHADGITFLFSRIAERVADAKMLSNELTGGHNGEPACNVLSVTYEPPASHSGLIKSSSPFLLWVDCRTHLISRLEVTTAYYLPNHETQNIKIILAFTRATVDEPISPDTFEFVPPEGATAISVL